MLVQGRTCVWCRFPIPVSMRSDARACSAACRKPLSRYRASIGCAPARSAGNPVSFGFAELASERRDGRTDTVRALHSGESGLAALVHELGMFEAWALALRWSVAPAALELCPGARLGPIHRPGNADAVDAVLFGSTPPAMSGEVPPVRLNTRRLDRQQATMHKPAQFWRWVFETLDVRQGDQFTDVYPGASGGRQAFEIYTLTTEGQRP